MSGIWRPETLALEGEKQREAQKMFKNIVVALVLFCTSASADNTYQCIVKDVTHLTDQGRLTNESSDVLSPEAGATFVVSDTDGVMHALNDGHAQNEGFVQPPQIQVTGEIFNSIASDPRVGRITDLRIQLYRDSEDKPFIYIDDFGDNVASGTCIAL